METNNIINDSIREQGDRLGQNQVKSDVLNTIKAILTSTFQIEESKFRNKGFVVDENAKGYIQGLIKADPRREAVIKETVKTQDFSWFDSEIKKIVSDAFQGWAHTQQNDGYINPKDIDPRDLLEDLRVGVVRLVFIKKGKPLRDDEGKIVKDANGEVVLDGGQKRVMYATRNKDLVSLYYRDGRTKGSKGTLKDDDVDTVANELSKDYFTVLDLAKEEFRTFKPSSLVEFDTEDNVASWIVYDVDNDAWFNSIHEGEPPSKYYVSGQLKAGYAPQNISRTRLEQQYRDEAIQSGSLKSEAVVQWERANQQNFLSGEAQYIRVLNGSYQDSQVDTAFEKICDFVRTVHQDIEPILEDSDVPNMFVSKRLNKRKRGNSMINASVELLIGDALLILSPYYIVNTKTGKVYLDRYSMFGRPANRSALTREEVEIHTFSDQLIEPFIDVLIESANLKHLPKPKKRERIMSEKDKRRFGRLEMLYNARTQPVIKEYLNSMNLQLGYVEGRNLIKITVKGTGVVFVVNSRSIGWLTPLTQEPEQIVNVTRPTSTLTDMREGLNKMTTRYRAHRNVVVALKTLDEFLLDNVFNLRVRSHKGVAFE